MGVKPLDPIMEELIRLQTLVDGEDDSNEYGINRTFRKSQRRPFLGGFSRGHIRDVERSAIGPSSHLQLSVRSWGCRRLARSIFASAAGFFISM
jgi:hypothetical protein